MLDVYKQKTMNCEASDKRREAAELENKALTTAELDGCFSWVKPWQEEMSHLGPKRDGDQHGWEKTWRKVTLTTAEINSFGGKQVLNRRGETFELSVFVDSYSSDEVHAFVVIPLIHVQHKVTNNQLHNHENRGWPSTTLLRSIRSLDTYADGLSENGESMFMDIPEPDLNARIAELEERDEKNEGFQAHQAMHTSSKAFVEGASVAARDVWKHHGEKIMGTAGKEGSLKSPGKLFMGKTIYQGELAGLGKDTFRDCQVDFIPIATKQKQFKKIRYGKKNKFLLFWY
jgi:hypothetical protein